jgi:threonine/homoserine/homoserine lactone efflux protein
MKFILFTFLTALLVIVSNPFLPYWAVMILIVILSALIGNKGASSFFAGGLGMSLAWVGQSIYVSAMSGSQLPEKMGELMGLGSDMALFVLTGILGFLLGAFSALSGSLLRKLLKRKPDNIYGG